jgi:hypothetical protein
MITAARQKYCHGAECDKILATEYERQRERVRVRRGIDRSAENARRYAARQKAVRYCKTPGCGGILEKGQRFCNPCQIVNEKARNQRNYARKRAQPKKPKPVIIRYCPDGCGAILKYKQRRCTECVDKTRRSYDASRQQMMRDATKSAKIARQPAPAKTPAPAAQKATTRPVVTSKPITAGSGVKHLQPSRDARRAEADRMDAIVWAAQQPGYNPRKCGEWVAKYFEMRKDAA